MRLQRDEPTLISVTPGELALLVEALDSFEYWQLGDVLPRNDGMVWIPGDAVGPLDRYWDGQEPTVEQAEAIDAVRACRRLAGELRSAMSAV